MIRDAIAALSGLEPPAQPRDGDCLTHAPIVTQRLVEAGLPAVDAWVTAWAAPGVLLLIHQVTCLGDYVVDDTARQFDPRFPARCIGEIDEYQRLFAAATGAVYAVVVRSRGVNLRATSNG